ncbi:MAG: PAS domain-containing protein [Sphingobacteriales bacterium]|nr:PAS domain-containing protein [Sphingobacteriales bacterium]
MSFYLSEEVFDFYEYQSEDLLCVCDTQFNIKRVNSNFKKLFLPNSALISGQLLTDFVPIPQNQKNAPQAILSSFIQKVQDHQEQYLWSANLVAESNSYIFTAKKMPKDSAEINLDNYQYFGELADALNEGYFILSRDWKVVYYNQKAEGSFKYPFLNLFEKDFLTVFPKTKETKVFTKFNEAFDMDCLVNFEEYSPTLKKWFSFLAVPYQGNLSVIGRDITHQVYERKTKKLKLSILEKYLEEQYSFAELMQQLLQGVEEIYPDMFTSVLKVENAKIHHLAAPRLPKSYLNLLDGMEIGAQAGSCGTAAFTRKMVIVEDIETDPLWSNYKNLILPHGFKSCWSIPIISTKELEVLATYGIYYQTNRKPTEYELRSIYRISELIRRLFEDSIKEEMIETSNARYEMVSLATNDVIYDYDFLTNKVFWNENVYQLFGFSHEEAAQNVTWWDDNLHEEDRDRILREMRDVKDQQQKIWSAEYRFKCKNGEYKYVFDRAILRYDSNGKPINMIGAMQDINALKMRELSILQQNEKLKEIAQISSHDLRRPVTSILGLVSLFEKEHSENNAQVVEYLGYATQELDEVIHTIVAKTLEADHTIYLKNAKIR